MLPGCVTVRICGRYHIAPHSSAWQGCERADQVGYAGHLCRPEVVQGTGGYGCHQQRKGGVYGGGASPLAGTQANRNSYLFTAILFIRGASAGVCRGPEMTCGGDWRII